MAGPLIVLWLGVGVGLGLGLLPSRLGAWAAPLRGVAALSALLVCGLQLLPHVLEAWGAWGLFWVMLAWGALALVQQARPRASRAVSRECGPPGSHRGDAAAETPHRPGSNGWWQGRAVAYGGLGAHWMVDGVVLATGGHGAGVVLAVVAHQVPILALIVLSCGRVGRSAVALAAVGLGLCTTLGYVLAGRLSGSFGEGAHTWADAIAAGLLLHLALHQLRHLSTASRAEGGGANSAA